MANKIKSPNEKSKGFAVILTVVILAVVGVIAFIVFNGKNETVEAVKDSMEKVSMTVHADDDYIQLTGLEPASDAISVDLYEDYSCPHCGELAEATDGNMKDQIEAGKLIVNIHTLNFLDGKVNHSSMAGSAALAIAKEGNAEIYWNYRKMLFDKQKDIYSAWKPDNFADAAAKMGADSKTVKAIKDGSDMEEFKKEAEANAKKLDETVGRISSPQVILDGKAISLVNADGTGFADWPKEVVDGVVTLTPEEK